MLSSVHISAAGVETFLSDWHICQNRDVKSWDEPRHLGPGSNKTRLKSD